MSNSFEACPLSNTYFLMFQDYDPSNIKYPSTSTAIFQEIEIALKAKLLPKQGFFNIVKFAIDIFKDPEKFKISREYARTKKYTFAKLIQEFPVANLNWNQLFPPFSTFMSFCIMQNFPNAEICYPAFYYPRLAIETVEDALKTKLDSKFENPHFGDMVNFTAQILKQPEVFDLSTEDAQKKVKTLKKLILDFPIVKLNKKPHHSMDILIAFCFEESIYNSFEFLNSIFNELKLGKRLNTPPSVEMLETCMSHLSLFKYFNERTKDMILKVKKVTQENTVDFRIQSVNHSFELLRFFLNFRSFIVEKPNLPSPKEIEPPKEQNQKIMENDAKMDLQQDDMDDWVKINSS